MTRIIATKISWLAVFTALVVALGPAMLDQPGQGSLDHPALGQHLKVALDDLHLQF